MIFFNEKKLSKIRIIFDIENWLWKSEIGNFRSLDLERVLIYQKFFFWKSAIFHSIKLPFDADVAEKILNIIYYWEMKKRNISAFDLCVMCGEPSYRGNYTSKQIEVILEGNKRKACNRITMPSRTWSLILLIGQKFSFSTYIRCKI